MEDLKRQTLYRKKDMNNFICGKGAQQQCFDRAVLSENNFFVVYQKQYANDKFTNTYNSYKNIDMFLNYYYSIPEDERRYYELIKNECCEYYDIDGKWEDGWKDIDSFLFEFIKLRDDFSKENDINNRPVIFSDMIVTEACNTVKMSLHIIIRQTTYFKKCTDQKVWATMFNDWIINNTDSKIRLDLSVYNSNSLMRLIGSHKGNDPSRKFKPYGLAKKIKDMRLFFCSYVKDLMYIPIDIKEKEKEHNLPSIELELSNNEVKEIFQHLNTSRWEDYESWRTLIWLGIKLGLTEGDIQEYSKNAQNYSEESTSKMINEYSPNKCNISIGTLFYYLEKDTDALTYKTLVKPYILDRLTQQKIDDLIQTSNYIEKTDKWVLPEIFDDDSRCVVIKAGLGKGKTSASVSHINSHAYDRIIVLTPRRTFAKSVCNRLSKETKHNFVIYSELKGKDYVIKNPFIVIQVESLNRLELNNTDKTLLLCDEIESVLFQMTVDKTHKLNHLDNLTMFDRLISSSTKIICLDAFISNKCLTTLKLMNVPYKYFNYTQPLEDRKCIRIDKKDNFLNKLILDLGTGKKIFLFSSSNKALTHDFIPKIKSEFPDKKIIEYHSKFTSIDLTHINDNWKDADVVCCTSTITVGCNFDIEDVFDKVYIFANASSRNLVRDIFQASYRVRHIRDKQLIYCVDKRHFGLNLSTYKKEIEQDLRTKSHYIVNQYEHHLKMIYPNKETPEWIRHLVLSNIYEQNMSIMMLEDMFKRYLSECSYEHEDIDEDELEEEMDMEEMDMCIDGEFDYKDIPELTLSQTKELRKKKIESSLTKMEEAQLEKYYFQHMLVEKDIWDVEDELWDVYKNYGKGKFRNLSYEKGYIDGSVIICDIVSQIYPEISNKLALRVELIDEICGTLGLEHSHDFSQISKDKLDSCVDWFRTNSKRIHNVFEIRDRNTENTKFTSRNTTDLINKVFSKWGYSKVKAGKKSKKRVNGEVIYTTPYNIENVNADKEKGTDIDVYRHIRPKKIRQTEKKVLLATGNLPPM